MAFFQSAVGTLQTFVIALRRNGRMSLTRPAAGGESCRAGFLSYRKLRFHTIKTLREDAHSAQGWMVAKATAPRRENVPRHILIHDNRMLAERAFYCLTCRILFDKDYNYGKKEKKKMLLRNRRAGGSGRCHDEKSGQLCGCSAQTGW